LRVGLVASGPLDDDAARALARLSRWIVGRGGTVAVPAAGVLLASAVYADAVFAAPVPAPTLAHGEAAAGAGYYIVETPTDHWIENLTGLGAAGVEIILSHTGDHPQQGHPLVPFLQVSAEPSVQELYGEDLDLALVGPPAAWAESLLNLLVEIASRRQEPLATSQRNTDFQFTRGLLGVSM
jgi:hypothetical protein